MDRFPTMLYRAPGSQALHGGHFDTTLVDDEAQLQAALKAGWCESTPAALAAIPLTAEGAQTAAVKAPPAKPKAPPA